MGSSRFKRRNIIDPAASNFARALKRVKCYMANAAIYICRHLPAVLYRNAAEFGQSLEYSLWVTREFGRASAFFATRERLWRRMLTCLTPDSEITVFEFGVAYGYTTQWWLSRCSLIDKWYGFDTFTGLPGPWRHFAAGAFDASGKPPEISDSRIEWVVGKVENTFSADRLNVTSSENKTRTQRVFILDLDLYEPTKSVAGQIFPKLQDGDILYFDEAADWDERRVLLEEMANARNPLILIGATPMALALQVESHRA